MKRIMRRVKFRRFCGRDWSIGLNIGKTSFSGLYISLSLGFFNISLSQKRW